MRARRPRSPQWLWGLLYAAPAVALVGAFVAYPFASILYHAFTRWDGIDPAAVGRPPQLPGALARPDLPASRCATTRIFALSVPIQVVVPLLVAYVIHRRVPGWRFFRATVFLPAVYATVVIGILTVDRAAARRPAQPGARRGRPRQRCEREWLGSASTSIPLILLVVVWTNFGYNVLLYLAGMSALDPSLEEAARIDGAGWLRILVSVIVPNLRRVLEIVLVVNTITAFAFMFTYIYTITNGGPGHRHLRLRVLHLPAGVHEPEHGLRRRRSA